MKIIRLTTFVALVVMLGITLTTPVTASGLTTNTDTESGQVRVVDSEGVRYLGTDANLSATGSGTPSARAAANNPESGSGFLSRSQLPKGFFTDVDSILTDFINLAFIIAVLLAFFYLIWAGFDWITSGGDRGKIETARTKILNVVIGIVVVAASYAIITLVLNFLGYSSLEAVFNEFANNTTL